MRRVLTISLILIAAILFSVNEGHSGETYYARSNLKVLKGTYITWVNWASSPQTIPIGTKFNVTYKGGTKATLAAVDTGASYTLDMGASGQQYLEKFVTTKKTSINDFPQNVQANINRSIAVVGMTKAQAYAAMGAPASTNMGKTHVLTYDQIMQATLWIYKRNRFGKNIGVSFNASSGLVDRTEGIWK